MNRFSSFLRWFFEPKNPPPQNLENIAQSLAAQAAYITQSSMYAYTRARLGLLMGKAFKEDIFVEALYSSAAIARFYISTDINLLYALYYSKYVPPHLLEKSISEIFTQSLKIPSEHHSAHPKPHLSVPPPKSNNPDFQDLSFIIPISKEQAQKEAENRFHSSLPTILSPEQSSIQAHHIASFSAEKLFILVPLTEKVKHLDKTMVTNNTIFRMMRLYEDISRSPHHQNILRILSEE
jgi:hypothetical protein